MNCEDVDHWLLTSAHQPMPAGVSAHIADCIACRSLVSIAESSVSAPPDSEVSGRIRAFILTDTKPVRPLPGVLVIGAIFFGIALLIALGGGLAVGPLGFPLLSAVQRLTIFGSLLALAGFSAVMAARCMRPGSGFLYTGMLGALALLLPEVVFLSVFRSSDLTRFVPAGVICLGIGLVFAIPTALLVWQVMSRGFIVGRTSAGTIAGLIGGITGLGMLEIHCPFLTAPHVGVWHVAVVAVSLVAGAGLPWAWDRRGAVAT